jgi:phospholipid-transporting ATPase
MLYVIAQLWFGFMSVFSGMTLYEPFIYQMFNFNFTGVSIMWYAIFDSAYPIKYANGKEYDRTADSLKKESELLRDPKLYSLGKENTHFNPVVFWTWIAYGFGQALMVVLISFYAN